MAKGSIWRRAGTALPRAPSNQTLPDNPPQLNRFTRRRLSSALVLLSLTACARPAVPTEVSATLVNNLVVLPVRINNSTPLSFILDTAASSSVIDRAAAQQLGLRFGHADAATTGGGQVEMAAISGAAASIGPLEFSQLPLVAIDLSSLEAGLGHKLDGILGYDIFNRYVVEIDYVASRVRFHESTESAAPGGEEVPLALDDQIPLVDVTVVSANGSRGVARVEFDTGQTGGLTLRRSFVDANQLLAPSQPSLAIRSGAIIAGGVTAQVTRLDSVKLGTAVVNNPMVNVTPGEKDAGVSTQTAGILGAEILKRFHVVVDYRRQRIRLRHNREFATPIEFDMSGMSLAATSLKSPSYRVRSIIEGSPAAEAGIAPNDVITHVNGAVSADTTLNEFRRMLRVPDAAYTLTVTRDGASRSVTLRTRRMI
jgi:predicted aspartyl protease